MSRTDRLDYVGARHHVMNRGARAEPIFFDDLCYATFLGFLADLPPRFGVRVHAYALLPNHFHLLLESASGRVSAGMQHLQGSYARWFNHRHRWDGPLWKDRFRSRLVEDEPWWDHLLAYVHLNPVKARLAPTADESRWTSHAAYAGISPRPDWLTTAEYLDRFGGTAGYRRYLWETRVGREEGPDGFRDEPQWPHGPAKELPPRPAPVRPTVEVALAQVARVTGVARAELRQKRFGPAGHPARKLAAWWLLQSAGLSPAAIARELGTSRPAMTRTLSEVRTTTDPQLLRWKDRLEAYHLLGFAKDAAEESVNS